MAASTNSLSIFKRATQFLRYFSSSAAAIHRPWNFYEEESDDSESEESAVYKHTLKFQRPSTIKKHQVVHNNSVNLIGKIDCPLKKINTNNGSFGLHTLLNVSASSSQSLPSFRVMLKMWGEIAEVSMEHLKPKDLVYIWGNLSSYMKADKSGNPKIRFEVLVKEINFVASDALASECPVFVKKESRDTGDDELEKYRNRIHLWQIFFTNPYEWMDLRKSKVNPRQPDFKHRDTGEALWLRTDDPPWIKRQLEVLDSRFVYQSFYEQLSPIRDMSF